MDMTKVDNSQIQPVRQRSDNALAVNIPGCGLMEAEGGEIVYIEVYGGVPRVLIWGDINDPDPTHVIDLSGALESNRKENADES